MKSLVLYKLLKMKSTPVRMRELYEHFSGSLKFAMLVNEFKISLIIHKPCGKSCQP